MNTPEPVVYQPQPLAYAPQPMPMALPQQPMQVAYFPGPNGLIAGYVPAQPVVVQAHPAAEQSTAPAAGASPLLRNAFYGAGAFAFACLGLHWLAAFVEALAHLLWALVALAAILCLTPVVWQVIRPARHQAASTTVIKARKVRIRKLVVKGGGQ